jgi:hypothetical protein
MKASAELNKRAKYLLRLGLAEQAFLEAEAMIDHVIQNRLDPSGHLYFACVAGIVVSYCRPFRSANGLGDLPKNLQDFQDSEDPKTFSEVHSNLVAARDKVAGHHDADFAEAQFQEKRLSVHPGQVTILFGEKGYGIETNVRNLSPTAVGVAKRLIAFQLRRVRALQTEFVISVLKETRAQYPFIVFQSSNGASPS